MNYQPHQRDIVYMDFSPQKGHEQAGRRPALVVSNDSYNRYTNLAIVCPITNTDNSFPLHVSLDSRTTTTGVVLCEHVKSVDLIARNASYVEQLPNDLFYEVAHRIRLSFE